MAGCSPHMAAAVPDCLAAALRFRTKRHLLRERLENHRDPQSWPVVLENQLGPMQGGDGCDKAEAKPGAGHRPAGVKPHEPLKHPGAVGFRNARAVVRNLKEGPCIA